MLNILAEAMLEAMVSPLKTRAGGDPACPFEIVAAGRNPPGQRKMFSIWRYSRVLQKLQKLLKRLTFMFF